MAKAPRIPRSQHLVRMQQARIRHTNKEATNRAFIEANTKEAKRLQMELLKDATATGAALESAPVANAECERQIVL